MSHEELPIAARVRRLEERLVEAGLATDEELDAALAKLYEKASPVNGARIVTRAWADAAYRERLLADGSAAAAEMGFPTQGSSGAGFRLRVVANEPGLHNLVVCTLCSCYPISLLGPSPSWYKSFAYRSRAVREPRVVLAEFGVTLPDNTEIAVWDATSETRYMVLPQQPADPAAEPTLNGLIGTATL